MGRLDGKLVLITGGGKEKSVGYGVARAFAKEGADLFICGVNKHKLKAARELEAEFGIRVVTHPMQGCSSKYIDDAVARAKDEFQRIDVLVCCLQAVRIGDLLEKTDDEDFDSAYDRLAGSYFRWMRACHPHLKDTGGSMIAFVSAAAESGTEGMVNLAAASGAIECMCKVAANEWEADGISVDTVRAHARTAQFERLAKQFAADYEILGGDAAFAELADIEDGVGAHCVELVLSHS